MLKREKIDLIIKKLKVIDNDTLVNFIHDMFGENDYLYELIRSHLIHYPLRKTDFLFNKYIIKKSGVNNFINKYEINKYEKED